MVHLEEISYEDARKEFFENLLIHKHNQLSYWLRQHDHYKCSELGAEISYIEDAIKALSAKPNGELVRERDPNSEYTGILVFKKYEERGTDG